MSKTTLTPAMVSALRTLAARGAIVAGLGDLREQTALALEARGLVAIKRRPVTYKQGRGVGQSAYVQTVRATEFLCTITPAGRAALVRSGS